MAPELTLGALQKLLHSPEEHLLCLPKFCNYSVSNLLVLNELELTVGSFVRVEQ